MNVREPLGQYTQETWRNIDYLDKVRMKFVRRRLKKDRSLIPEKLGPLIQSRVREAIEFALKQPEGLFAKGTAKNRIVVRVRDASHVIPFIEKAMFDEFLTILAKDDGNVTVDKEMMFFFDPRLLNMTLVDRDTGKPLPLENAGSHELQHFFAAQNLGANNGYIMITLYWEQNHGKQQLSCELGLYDPDIINSNLEKKNLVEILTAPETPSADDYFLEYRSCEGNLISEIQWWINYRFGGKMVAGEVMKKAFDQWEANLEERIQRRKMELQKVKYD